MSNKYNALDNIEQAKKLREQLILEKADIEASIQYDLATGFCSNCPHIDHSDEYENEWNFFHIADSCCKDDPDWETNYYPSFQIINKLITAITEYLNNAEPQIASLSEEEQP